MKFPTPRFGLNSPPFCPSCHSNALLCLLRDSESTFLKMTNWHAKVSTHPAKPFKTNVRFRFQDYLTISSENLSVQCWSFSIRLMFCSLQPSCCSFRHCVLGWWFILDKDRKASLPKYRQCPINLAFAVARQETSVKNTVWEACCSVAKNIEMPTMGSLEENGLWPVAMDVAHNHGQRRQPMGCLLRGGK